MRNYILTISITFLFQLEYSYAQEGISATKSSYEIVANTTDHNNQYFINALENANMESYRLKNSNVNITFKEGVKCIIISASELSKFDNKININNYKENFIDGFTMPLFSINQSGSLLAEYKKKLK